MPDQSDAEDALAALAALALYPAGLAEPSVTGVTTRIYRGWPNAAALDADLAAGRVNVTVFPVPGATRNTTRYPPEWHSHPAPPTLTVANTASTATFAGDAAPGQLAGILVDGHSYVHRTGSGETPAYVAAILATAIATVRPALAAGPTVTIPGAATLVARTAADATSTAETRRQLQSFRITAWCPTPGLRDATVAAIDATFAATPFLSFPLAYPGDTASGRLRFVATTTFDQSQDARLYRRDLIYTVEFPTLQSASQSSMLFGVSGLGTVLITV